MCGFFHSALFSGSVYGIVYIRFHCFLHQIILLWTVYCLSLADGNMDYFHHLAIVNGTCRNIRVHWHEFPFPPVLTLDVGSLGLTLHHFSVRQCQGVGLLHIPSSACYWLLCANNHLVGVKWQLPFWFAAPWWLRKLNIFSCSCCSFVYILWGDVCSSSLLFLKLGSLFLCCRNFYHGYDLKIFFSSHGLCVTWVMGSFHVQNFVIL